MTRSGTRVIIPVLLAAGLALVGSPGTLAEADARACRVRNVTQETSGASFSRMLARARDGDRLRVKGLCQGGVLIEVDIAIRGAGAAATLTGRRSMPVLSVARDASVRIRNLTIERGYGRSGGGIENRGTLVVVASVLRYNVGSNGGGGIFNGRPGKLTVLDSLFRLNRTGDKGAGLLNRGIAKVSGSSFRRNRAGFSGGGIENAEDGTLTVTGSAIRRNRARDLGGGVGEFLSAKTVLRDTVIADNAALNGGGLSAYGDLTLTHSTVTRNDAAVGGGIYNEADLVLAGSLVVGNTASEMGGGIYNEVGGFGSVTLDAASSVTGNTPDDCAGTAAC